MNELIIKHTKFAEDYYKDDKWKEALEELNAILAVDIDNKNAQDKIINIKAEIIRLYNIGSNYYEKRNYIKAIEEWQFLLAKVPDYPNLVKLISTANQELKSQMQTKDIILTYYNDAMSGYKSGNLQLAIENCRKILNLNPKHEDTLKFFNMIVDGYFKEGMKYYEQNQYAKAINEWKNVLNIDPINEKAKYYIKEAKDKYEKKINKYYQKV